MIGEFRAATRATPSALWAELATSDSDAAIYRSPHRSQGSAPPQLNDGR
jgi:hypothetical protein